MDTNNGPFILFPEQLSETAALLGKAFVDDPGFVAIIPQVADPVSRSERFRLLFEVVLDMHVHAGEPVLGIFVNGRLAGAAIVDGIGGGGIVDLIRTGLPRIPALLRAVGSAGTIRALRLFQQTRSNRPRQPHVYLNVLGVDPAFRGRHCGLTLLDHIRQLAAVRDALGGVYLETANPANVAYYQRSGYRQIGEMVINGVRMFRMMQERARG